MRWATAVTTQWQHPSNHRGWGRLSSTAIISSRKGRVWGIWSLEDQGTILGLVPASRMLYVGNKLSFKNTNLIIRSLALVANLICRQNTYWLLEESGEHVAGEQGDGLEHFPCLFLTYLGSPWIWRLILMFTLSLVFITWPQLSALDFSSLHRGGPSALQLLQCPVDPPAWDWFFQKQQLAQCHRTGTWKPLEEWRNVFGDEAYT